MTATVKGTTINLTRGDTLKVKIDISTSDDEPYVPLANDVIRFAMKKTYKDAEPLLTKIIDNNSLILQLDPLDTKDLKQPSDYVYDIQLTHANGDVDTFISKGKLRIIEEVD